MCFLSLTVCPVIVFSLCRTSVSLEAMRVSRQMIFIWNRSISIRNGCTLSENSSPPSLSRFSLAITPRWASLSGSGLSHNQLLNQSFLPPLHLFVRYYVFLCLLGWNQCQKSTFQLRGLFFFFLLCKGNLYDYPIKYILCNQLLQPEYYRQFPQINKSHRRWKKSCIWHDMFIYTLYAVAQRCHTCIYMKTAWCCIMLIAYIKYIKKDN